MWGPCVTARGPGGEAALVRVDQGGMAYRGRECGVRAGAGRGNWLGLRSGRKCAWGCALEGQP